MMDYDGKTDYSNIVFLKSNFETSTVGNIYPNPTTDGKISIEINSKNNKNWSINSFDIQGKQLSNEIIQLNKGLNILNLKINSNKSGLIIYKFQNEEGAQLKKVLKLN
jgi:Secretion system C-terminal sorting domain